MIMINFDSLSLKALINEIEPVLIEGRVQKVQQSLKKEIILTVRALRETRKLYICVDPKYAHACFLSQEGERLRNLEIPAKPPMFCMLLRKHMEGAKIKSVIQPGFERIMEISFESYNELGERISMILACEFMGKYSNIILYNQEDKIIQGCAHFVSSEKSRERELAGGYKYIYPPVQDKLNPEEVSEEGFLHFSKIMDLPPNIWLNKKFGFISKALADELCEILAIEVNKDTISAINQEKIHLLYRLISKTVSLENINPSISEDYKFFSLIGVNKSIQWNRLKSVNSMIDSYFGNHVFQYKFSKLKSSLISALKKEIKKQQNKLQGLRERGNSVKYDNYKERADLIMANLYKIQKGDEFTTLQNFFSNGAEVTIPIDSRLTASENAQKYYKLYNKGKNAAKYAQEVTNHLMQEIGYLETVAESLKHAQTLDDLKEIQMEMFSEEIIKRALPEAKPAKKGKTISSMEYIGFAKYLSSDGQTILRGKNNRQNDLLLKHSSAEDIWLHSQNIPGSHVILKTDGKTGGYSETALHEAVYLAAYYSAAGESANVPVVYTCRKYVKKPPASKPGFVIYSNEKTLVVNPDKSKILEHLTNQRF